MAQYTILFLNNDELLFLLNNDPTEIISSCLLVLLLYLELLWNIMFGTSLCVCARAHACVWCVCARDACISMLRGIDTLRIMDKG